MKRCLLIASIAVGCSDDAAPPPAQPPPTTPSDATSDGAIGLDDPAGPPSYKRAKPRTARTIDIQLRSTPYNASAYVDNEYVGETPTIWSGEPTGTVVEFMFTLPGHTIARYRFIPVTSGVVHGRLEPIEVPRDAGLAPRIAPALAPDAGEPVAPPVDAPASPPPAPVDAGSAALLPAPIPPAAP